MRLANIALICTTGNRTKAYLQLMRKHRLLPNYCLIMSADALAPVLEASTYREAAYTGEYFDIDEPVVYTLEQCEIPYSIIETGQVNDSDVYEEIMGRDEDVWIYSGFGGQILKRPLINCGKRFLHVHPGIVPKYKGSTTIYYSLLKEGTCGASAIFLAESIDTGPIIAQKQFEIKDNPPDLDYVIDPFIRASLLVEVLAQYRAIGDFQTYGQEEDEGETYFIIHPVLKHIAIMSEVERKRKEPI